METIDTVQLRLTKFGVALMLIYLLGDVLRIFSGDFKAGGSWAARSPQTDVAGIAALMVIPSSPDHSHDDAGAGANRWLNIIVAVFSSCSIWSGCRPIRPGTTVFLLVVSLGFNVMTVWYAWKWQYLEVTT